MKKPNSRQVAILIASIFVITSGYIAISSMSAECPPGVDQASECDSKSPVPSNLFFFTFGIYLSLGIIVLLLELVGKLYGSVVLSNSNTPQLKKVAYGLMIWLVPLGWALYFQLKQEEISHRSKFQKVFTPR